MIKDRIKLIIVKYKPIDKLDDSGISIPKKGNIKS